MKRGKIQELKEIEIEFLKFLKEKTSPDSDFGYFFSAFEDGHDLTEKEKAKERQAKGKENLPNVESSSEKFSGLEEGEAKEKTAKKLGWSRPSLDKALEIDGASKENPKEYGDLEEKMEDSVHSAYNELKEYLKVQD